MGSAAVGSGVRTTRAKHGTRSRYTAGRCRCWRCRKANRDYQRGYMATWNARRRSLERFYLAVAVELFRRRADA